MSQIGQIVYNVEDYSGHGGLISSSKDEPLTKTVIDDGINEVEKIDIYNKNIFENISASKITKLGIQAPPGTQFILNENADLNNSLALNMMIGRTGIYELELSGEGSNIITSLRFIKPAVYVLDESESFTRTQQGITNMNKAREDFENKHNQLKLLHQTASNTEANQEYWEEYDVLYKTYCQEYESARALYLQGINGVYKKTEESELQNIIIDFYYDSETGSTN